MISYPNLRPEIFSVGPLTVRWYGLMYVIGYFLGYQLVKWRARKGLFPVTYRACESYVTYLIVGMLIGARLTYVFVYNWDTYSVNPIEALYVWKGGLSFHGAAVGMAVASYFFARKHRIPFYSVLDALAFAAPPGLFFGRLGNFINAELYGRVTDVPWAMVFPTDPQRLPRHPSQLYEAALEGLALTLCLIFLQRHLVARGIYRHGYIGAGFGILYGIFRFMVEFTREPDAQLGLVLGPFSMGQILCFLTFLVGVFLWWDARRRGPALKVVPASPEFLNA